MQGLPLLWVSIGLFVAGVFVKGYTRELSAAGWLAFGSFWLSRVPVYLEVSSFIKTVLSIAALPLSAYVAYHVYHDGRETLLKLSQAVAAMGLIYMPFFTIPELYAMLIEHTASQVITVLDILGVNAELATRDGLDSAFLVTNPETGETYKTYMILACTGIGSMAMFAGLISVIDAPVRRRLLALSVTVGSIYVLNIARNVFIATAYGYQLFPYGEGVIADVTGEYEAYASFFWADKVISQSLSVVVLVGLLLVTLRFLPEMTDLLDEVLKLAGLRDQGSGSGSGA